MATRITQTPGMIILLAASGEKAQMVFARSADLSQDMNMLLKQILPLVGNGRGGGQAQMAQGGGVSADAAQIKLALDAAEQELTQN